MATFRGERSRSGGDWRGSNPPAGAASLRRARSAAARVIALALFLAVLAFFLWKRVGAADAASVAVPELEANKVYYWKVIVEDEHGTLVESETRRFEVR